VDGVADSSCPKCGHDAEWEFYVFVDNDIIARVAPADGTYNFVAAGRTYIVLQN
jgi:hypothetical protein